MGALSISNYKITVPAGGEVPIVSTGSRVRCLSATGTFRLGLESEATFPFEGGMSIALPDGSQFANMRVVNPGGAPITVELVVSFGDFTDDRATFAGTINAAIASMPAVTIAPGQSVSLTGTSAVSVTNTPSVSIIGTVPVSMAASPPSPLNLIAYSETSIAAGATILINSANTLIRQYWVQHRRGPAVRMGHNVVSANMGIRLASGQSITIDGGPNIYIHNPGASAALIARMALAY